MPVNLNVIDKLKSLSQTPDLRTLSGQSADTLPGLIAAAERAALSILGGEQNLKRPGGGQQFWQYRAYSAQDRPQDIDWRQSAKTETLFVREQEKQVPQKWALWCAHGESMHYRSARARHSKQQAANILTLALAILAVRGGGLVSLLPEGKDSRTDNSLNKMAEALLHPPAHKNLYHPESEAPTRKVFGVFGDFWGDVDTLARALEPLAARSGAGILVQIADPDELDWPFTGRIICKQTENDDTNLRVENAGSLKQEYRHRIAAHQEALSKLCASCGWAFIIHRTDEDPAATLRALWLAMDRSAKTKGP